MTSDAHRIAELDGVRGIAILSVIVAHAFGVPLLWAGVDLFFVLSGFLITGILLRQREAGGAYFSYFYARRARRIIAPYVLLLVVSSLLFGTAWVEHWYWFAFFAMNIGGALHQLGHETLGPLWSLAVEEQFYLVWPFIVLMAPQRSLLKVSLGLFLAAPILRALATPWFATHFPIYYLTPFRMDLLSAGAILACLQRWNRPLLCRVGYWPYIAFAGTAASLLALAVVDTGFRTGSNTVRGNVFIYTSTNILATSLVVIALTGQGLLCVLLRNPVLRYIGKISYSMYLIYMTAGALAHSVFPGRVMSFVVAFSLSVLYATVTWYGFERRLLSNARPFLIASEARSPAP